MLEETQRKQPNINLAINNESPLLRSIHSDLGSGWMSYEFYVTKNGRLITNPAHLLLVWTDNKTETPFVCNGYARYSVAPGRSIAKVTVCETTLETYGVNKHFLVAQIDFEQIDGETEMSSIVHKIAELRAPPSLAIVPA